MGITFNIEETLQMAIQIEQNGRAFYLKAAEQTIENAVKKVLLNLADMETKHEEFFKKLKADLTSKEKQQDTYDPDNEGVLYLNAFASGHVFNVKSNPAQALTGKETPVEIFKTAIGLEKDSIVFYLGIKAMVPENLGKTKVDTIIKEEMSHIRIISEHLEKL